MHHGRPCHLALTWGQAVWIAGERADVAVRAALPGRDFGGSGAARPQQGTRRGAAGGRAAPPADGECGRGPGGVKQGEHPSTGSLRDHQSRPLVTALRVKLQPERHGGDIAATGAGSGRRRTPPLHNQGSHDQGQALFGSTAHDQQACGFEDCWKRAAHCFIRSWVFSKIPAICVMWQRWCFIKT